MNKIKEGFSIVICTHNGASKLTPTLTHIAALNKPVDVFVEVILVNNASTDNTAQLSSKLWNELKTPFPLRIFNEERAGKGFATETGYDAAKYSYIITVDDDNWLREDYLINAFGLIKQYPDVGIFQAGNEPAFESLPAPEWLELIKQYLVIGSPIDTPGYYPNNIYSVWGAGMIIKTADWQYLRHLGFAALTSKVPGKAAGEDVELAIALRLMGRKIYYSPLLFYKHYMPAGRVNWQTLKKNFSVFGYTDYYFQLYAMVFAAYKTNDTLTASKFRLGFLKHWLRLMKSRGLLGNIKYLFEPEQQVYQLMIKQYYSVLYWYVKLSGNAIKDMLFIQSWMLPLLKKNPDSFII